MTGRVRKCCEHLLSNLSILRQLSSKFSPNARVRLSILLLTLLLLEELLSAILLITANLLVSKLKAFLKKGLARVLLYFKMRDSLISSCRKLRKKFKKSL